MSLRRVKAARNRAYVIVAASALALSLSGCGGGGGGSEESDASDNPKANESADSGTPSQEIDTGKVLAELKGANDAIIRVHSAVRDEGGFVTVSATLTNEGDKPFIANRWHSSEASMKSKSSISGATLVDPKGKKRYMILRDTDGECLCTTGLSNIKPDESRAIYAQFPSPPKEVKEVDFQLPGVAPARLNLTEG